MGGDRRALVLGAGISGLAAAHRLRAVGFAVTVLEASDRPGGTLRTERVAGFRAELGPSTVLRGPKLEALAAAAGLELIEAAPEAKRRYLLHRGRPVPLPGTPPALATSPLLSLAGRLRLLAEPLQGPGPGPEESVAAFLARRFGRQAAERAADALVAGVYAGDPEELAIGPAFPRLYALETEHGSVLKGLAAARGGGERRRPAGLRGGFQALAERLAAGMDVRVRHRAVSLERDGGGFRVSVETASGPEEHRAERLVSALPAGPSAELLAGLGEVSAAGRLPHAPVAVLALGYARGEVAHPLDGFGFLVPRTEGRDVLGCLFSSTLFPDSAPAGHVLLTAMAGGRLRPELCDLPGAELLGRVRRDLEEVLGISAPPIHHALAVWRPGIPQYTALMPEVRAQIRRLEEAHPGLSVLGSWLRGVGVPDCLRAAAELGEVQP